MLWTVDGFILKQTLTTLALCSLKFQHLVLHLFLRKTKYTITKTGIWSVTIVSTFSFHSLMLKLFLDLKKRNKYFVLFQFRRWICLFVDLKNKKQKKAHKGCMCVGANRIWISIENSVVGGTDQKATGGMIQCKENKTAPPAKSPTLLWPLNFTIILYLISLHQTRPNISHLSYQFSPWKWKWISDKEWEGHILFVKVWEFLCVAHARGG